MTDNLSDVLKQRFGAAPGVPPEFEQNDNLGLLATHTSHRHFTDAPVDAALLDTLLCCALAAPAKSDLQQVAVVRVADPGKRQAIAAMMPSMPWIGTAPEFLVFAGDNRRIRRISERSGKPFGNDHLDSFFNASVDAALVMMNFIMAARAAGLGSCPVSAVRIHAEAISDLLEMPSWVFPVAGLALGHPKFGNRVTPRLSPMATVHTDKYDDSAFDALVDEYDRRRHAAMPLPQDRQRLADTYADAEFYGWSEDKARQVSVPERADFGDYVRRQGYSLD